jgi:flagellar basal body-associated protein FliL
MMMSKVLGVLATIFISVGIIVTIWAFQPSEQSEEKTIPFGEEWIIYYEFSGWINGHVSGDFVVAPENGIITVHIMDKEAYERYILMGILSDTLYSETGSSGSFSVDLPSTSKYYLVFEHADRVSEQTFDLDMRVTGIIMLFLVAGIATVVVGVFIAILSFRMKAKQQPVSQQQGTKSDDVTIFGEEQKTP